VKRALDTNILVRFLVVDDPTQSERARKLLSEGEAAGERFVVCVPVVLETCWILSAVYERPRESILDALEALLCMPVLEFEAHDRLQRLIRLGRSTPTDLADLLIGLTARDLGCGQTLTFDRKAASSELFHEL
jgi:predicted nucleic-acid-binding protein